MKGIAFLLILLGLRLSAQEVFVGPPDGPILTIETADGTLINPAGVQLDHKGKRVSYAVAGQKIQTLKFEKVKQVNIGMNVFRVFGPKDFKGYYIKAETDTRILASMPLKFYETAIVDMLVVVLDSDGNVLESIEMNNVKKRPEKRLAVRDMVRRNFGDCAEFTEYFNNFDYDSDTQKMQIWGFFAMTNYVDCK